jgi:8-oxo-dGTP diphosphatase
MKTRIWLTGFEPFGSHVQNPSQILVEQLLGTHHEQQLHVTPPYGLESELVELEFAGEILTVDIHGSQASLPQIEDFDAVIHIGLNEKVEKINLEMCAINESNFRIPDNQGRMVQQTSVEDSGLALLHTTVHRPSIVATFEDDDSVEISEDCGRFVCNETYYRTLHEIETKGLQRRGRAIPAIFVHIPDFSFVPLERQLQVILELSARISQKPVVQVVGGVLVNENEQILACKRASDQVMGGYWEFPGGKVDASETKTAALERELFEELGIHSQVESFIDKVVHDYPSMIVSIDFYKCSTDAQVFSQNVHDDFEWVDEESAAILDWLPADIDFVQQLIERRFSSI